jgi:hypothetical protein
LIVVLGDIPRWHVDPIAFDTLNPAPVFGPCHFEPETIAVFRPASLSNANPSPQRMQLASGKIFFFAEFVNGLSQGRIQTLIWRFRLEIVNGHEV